MSIQIIADSGKGVVLQLGVLARGKQVLTVKTSQITVQSLWNGVMGRECSTYGKREIYTRFLWGNHKGRDHVEDIGVDERIILNVS